MTEISRRGFLKAAGAGLAGLLIGCSEKAPRYDNVAEVAGYLQRHLPYGLDLSDFKDNKGKLVYIFPDIHCTTYHKMHKDNINRLNKLMGLDLAGMEGADEGEVKPKDIEEALKIILNIQSKTGERHQLAENEARFNKTEAKTIENLDDYLEVSPLCNFAYEGDGITLVGLEDNDTGEQNKKLEALMFLYEKYFEVKKPIYENEKRIKDFEKQLKSDEFNISMEEFLSKRKLTEKRAENESQFKELEEIKKLYDKEIEKRLSVLKKIRDEMDKQREGLDYELPDYDEGIKESYSPYISPFYEAVHKIHEKVQMNARSEDCARIIVDEMDKRKVNQGAVVYGQAHLEQIKEALDKKGVSYLVIKIKSDK